MFDLHACRAEPHKQTTLQSACGPVCHNTTLARMRAHPRYPYRARACELRARARVPQGCASPRARRSLSSKSGGGYLRNVNATSRSCRYMRRLHSPGNRPIENLGFGLAPRNAELSQQKKANRYFHPPGIGRHSRKEANRTTQVQSCPCRSCWLQSRRKPSKTSRPPFPPAAAAPAHTQNTLCPQTPSKTRAQKLRPDVESPLAPLTKTATMRNEEHL